MDTGTHYQQQALSGMPQTYAAATNISNIPNATHSNANPYNTPYAQQAFNNLGYAQPHFQHPNMASTQGQYTNYQQLSNYFLTLNPNQHTQQQNTPPKVTNPPQQPNPTATKQPSQVATTTTSSSLTTPTFFDEKKPTHTLRFKSLKKFHDKYKDYFLLDDYIKSIKPKTSIVSAVINKFSILVIRTDNTKDAESLVNWPDDAFEHGVEFIKKIPKYYLALHYVSTHVNV